MPLVDLNDPTLYDGGPDSLYTSASGAGLERSVFLQGYYNDADKLIDALMTKGMAPGQRIVMVGAQFGWVGERLIQRGFGPAADGTLNGRVACLDTSTYFQDATRKAANATLTIRNDQINGSTGRRALKIFFGSQNITIDWCITHILTMLIGAGPAPSGANEIEPFCDACRLLSTNVAHWVTPLMSGPPSQDARLNLKTMQEWKNWVSPDWVVWEGRSDII